MLLNFNQFAATTSSNSADSMTQGPAINIGVMSFSIYEREVNANRGQYKTKVKKLLF